MKSAIVIHVTRFNHNLNWWMLDQSTFWCREIVDPSNWGLTILPSLAYLGNSFLSCATNDNPTLRWPNLLMNLICKISNIVLMICLLLTLASTVSGQGKEMQKFNNFQIDRTEVTIGDFRKFVEATKFRSQAEVEGGGFEYGAGLERRPGWTWQRPHGVTANDQEPAVH